MHGRTRAVCISVVFLTTLGIPGCSDDRISLRRGPLGPASYRVEVSATGEATELAAESQAELDVEPRGGGATSRLRTTSANVFEPGSRAGRRGPLALEGVRGATVGPGTETDLASLAGQLDPPLPPGPVRLGDEWSSERRISI